MRTRTILKRLEKLEKTLRIQRRFEPDCICFPGDECPRFHWLVEYNIADQVKCPLHGQRFRPQALYYVAAWLREKREARLQKRHSPQYRKAWYASFPSDLWPAEEIISDRYMTLKLKDGTEIDAGPRWGNLAS